MKLIVADSGPLIAWACSGHIDVLQAIFPEVLIPETVFVECTANTVLPGAQAIAAAVVAGNPREFRIAIGCFLKTCWMSIRVEAAVLALWQGTGPDPF
ncbi:MAG: hypothetical protein IPG34_04195 [Rhodocyclaceae bacterium]|nr:hypothetical protein [Rhodocyclaceae bacterium]